MRQFVYKISLPTCGKGLYDFTSQAADWVAQSGIATGLLTLFVRHTSASLLVQENYDPEVKQDLERFFARLVPEGDPMFEHVMEGPDDMPAHVRSALTQTSLSIPVIDGAPALGTWQGIFLYEHRAMSAQRQVVLHLLGE